MIQTFSMTRQGRGKQQRKRNVAKRLWNDLHLISREIGGAGVMVTTNYFIKHTRTLDM